MFTARTLKILAAVTLVLFAVTGAIGDGKDVLWVLDDVLFFGFIIAFLALVVVAGGVLARSTRRGPAR